MIIMIVRKVDRADGLQGLNLSANGKGNMMIQIPRKKPKKEYLHYIDLILEWWKK